MSEEDDRSRLLKQRIRELTDEINRSTKEVAEGWDQPYKVFGDSAERFFEYCNENRKDMDPQMQTFANALQSALSGMAHIALRSRADRAKAGIADLKMLSVMIELAQVSETVKVEVKEDIAEALNAWFREQEEVARIRAREEAAFKAKGIPPIYK